MGQLYAGHAAVGFYKTGDALQVLDVLIFPNAKVLRGNAALGRNSCGLGKYQPGTTHGPAAQMHQVPVIDEAVL